MSFHAVGAAIDINTSTNPYREDNALVTDMPDWFVRAWTDAGWCWGGHWQTIKDPMHFSWQGPLHTETGPSVPAPVRTEPESFTRFLELETSLGPAPDKAHLLLADLRIATVPLMRCGYIHGPPREAWASRSPRPSMATGPAAPRW